MYKWINSETGELRKNIWDIAGLYIWYFFYCMRNGYKPSYPGRWKYNEKGWV